MEPVYLHPLDYAMWNQKSSDFFDIRKRANLPNRYSALCWRPV